MLILKKDRAHRLIDALQRFSNSFPESISVSKVLGYDFESFREDLYILSEYVKELEKTVDEHELDEPEETIHKYIGNIVHFDEAKGYGFIKYGAESIYFHVSKLVNRSVKIKKGDTVSFTHIVSDSKGKHALGVDIATTETRL